MDHHLLPSEPPSEPPGPPPEPYLAASSAAGRPPRERGVGSCRAATGPSRTTEGPTTDPRGPEAP